MTCSCSTASRSSAKSRAPGSPTVADEWTVEARGGGICVVRVVHSLFASTDDWDNQLDGLEQGWPAYFRILRMYLETFKGMACSAMQFVGFSSDSEARRGRRRAGSWGSSRLLGELMLF